MAIHNQHTHSHKKKVMTLIFRNNQSFRFLVDNPTVPPDKILHFLIICFSNEYNNLNLRAHVGHSSKELLVYSFLFFFSRFLISPVSNLLKLRWSWADYRFSILLGCPFGWTKVGSICIVVLCMARDHWSYFWNWSSGLATSFPHIFSTDNCTTKFWIFYKISTTIIQDRKQ